MSEMRSSGRQQKAVGAFQKQIEHPNRNRLFQRPELKILRLEAKRFALWCKPFFFVAMPAICFFLGI